MGLNLHNIVRPVITAVNPDMAGLWLVSTGYSPNGAGKQIPAYATPVQVTIQSQPPSGEQLQHVNFMNLQGTFRSIYMYGNPQSIVRVEAKGGDLIQFPQNYGAPNDNWLVVHAEEQGWNLTDGSWSKVIAQLQTDRPS